MNGTITITTASYFANVRNTLDVFRHNRAVGLQPTEFDTASLASFKHIALATFEAPVPPLGGDTMTFQANVVQYINELTVTDGIDTVAHTISNFYVRQGEEQ